MGTISVIFKYIIAIALAFAVLYIGARGSEYLLIYIVQRIGIADKQYLNTILSIDLVISSFYLIAGGFIVAFIYKEKPIRAGFALAVLYESINIIERLIETNMGKYHYPVWYEIALGLETIILIILGAYLYQTKFNKSFNGTSLRAAR
jgi:hypothetical protein